MSCNIRGRIWHEWGRALGVKRRAMSSVQDHCPANCLAVAACWVCRHIALLPPCVQACISDLLQAEHAACPSVCVAYLHELNSIA